MNLKAREGDLLETKDNIIFDVKGLAHPPYRIIAFPRYIPDPNGDRTRDGSTYRKIYALSKRYDMLRENFPEYLIHDQVFDTRLCEVPLKDIKRHYKPTDRLKDLLQNEDSLDKAESQALDFLTFLREHSSVSWNKIGISGSILVRLHKENSDIDPIVYGSKTCQKTYTALETLLKDDKAPAKPYNLEGLKQLFAFRSKDTAIHFDDFVRTESRKIMQGKFRGRDYFIRFVKDWNEIQEPYGTIRYTSHGYSRIEARVVDDSTATFTPCSYKIDHVKILDGPRIKPLAEIASFRGRFCEQARAGEVVIAQGKVEKVQKQDESAHYRLLLGSSVSDYMILA